MSENSFEYRTEHHFDVYAVEVDGKIEWYVDLESAGFTQGTVFDTKTGEWRHCAEDNEIAFDERAYSELEKLLKLP
jgi:hypothetical protein